MDRDVSIAIIGGGPAGLSAASAARKAGVTDILIMERDGILGGILNQCIHNGFGLHTFQEELTGPEYASRFVQMVEEEKIPYLLHTIVIDLSVEEDGRKRILAMNKEEGLFVVHCDAVILGMGCRERPRGALSIPGFRPAGIYSAGTAQRLVNIEGKMPGREVVILGSGDIGLIMARRMTLEGAKVKVVAELMPYSGGLKRNIVQCLNDFDIPLKLSHTIIDIKGKERVEAVTIAEVDANRKPIPGTEETYSCDTVLLSCGLIPENELSEGLGVAMNPVTNGPMVNESLETSVPGVFACGNVLHVHDLVDYVSEEASQAGKQAAAYVSTNSSKEATTTSSGESAEKNVTLVGKDGVRYTVPMTIRLSHMADTQLVRFRVGANYRDAAIVISYNGVPAREIKKKILAPGEMEQVTLVKKDLEAVSGLETITIAIRENA